MNDKTAKSEQTVTRKPYHTPRMDDYGFVNQLTQATATGAFWPDNGGTLPIWYTSQPN